MSQCLQWQHACMRFAVLALLPTTEQKSVFCNCSGLSLFRCAPHDASVNGDSQKHLIFHGKSKGAAQISQKL